MKKSTYQSGQALLIILLVMAVGLTLALSIVSRSVTDIRISKEQEESARAFSVAEAGIEESLRAGFATDVELEGIRAEVTETGQGGGAEFVFEELIDRDDTQTVWLVEHDSDGNPDPDIDPYTGTQIWLYWGNDGTGTGNGKCKNNPIPALEATIIYNDGTFKVKRIPLDPDEERRTDCNNFKSVSKTSGGYSLGGKTFNYKRKINLPSSGRTYALRLRLLYNDIPHILGVKAVGDGVAIPTQGKCYESTATVPESGITRKVRQCQSYPAPPAIFDYVLFSGGNLEKPAP